MEPVKNGRLSWGRVVCNKVAVCPKAAFGCGIPVYNASELRRRRCRRHITFYRNLRKGTHGGRRRSDPEASHRMRQLIPPIHGKAVCSACVITGPDTGLFVDVRQGSGTDGNRMESAYYAALVNMCENR